MNTAQSQVEPLNAVHPAAPPAPQQATLGCARTRKPGI